MSAIAINCRMERETASGESEIVSLIAIEELSRDGVEAEMVWAIDRNMLPGMNSFEDDGVEWPALRQPMLESRVFVIGRPS